MRDHIEFVQAQRLPWADGARYGRPGARLKLLSEDPESRALSGILGYPAGWTGADEALEVDEEIYVLDGAVSISGTEYREDSYAFLPAGYPRCGVAAPGGVTFLSFLSGRPGAATAGAAFDQRRLVRKVDLTESAWDGDFDKFGLGSMKSRAQMRILRDDPVTGENTYITATVPFRHGERAERHPIVQEFFLLWGELAGNTGIMQGGAYCFRPPMVKHGPYGSRSGAVILFRSLGGGQETLWEDAPPFTFTPAHAPFLPEQLREAATPYPRPPRY
jgi:hypothetical protein